MKIVSLLATFLLFLAPAALADWDSTIAINNTGQTASNSTTVYYYDSSGQSVLTYNAPSLPPSGSVFIDGVDVGLPSGENYSAVVSSDQWLAGVVGQNYEDTTVSGEGAWSGPVSDVYFPIVNPSSSTDWNAYIGVQNTSSQNTQATCQFYDSSGAPVASQTAILPPQGSHRFAVYNYDILGVPSDFTGSAYVNADQSVAASIFGNWGQNTWAYEGLGYPGSIGTTAYLPSVYGPGYYGWNTYVGIQNCGSSAATVGINYYCPDGCLYLGGTVIIPPYGSYQYDLSNSGLPAGYSYSAVYHSNQPIAVAGVNRHSSGLINAYRGYYSGWNTGWHPWVRNYYGQYGWSSNLKIMNVNNQTGTYNVTYWDQYGANVYSYSVGIPAWTTVIHSSSSYLGNSSFLGSVQITGSQPHVSVLNHWAAYNSAVNMTTPAIPAGSGTPSPIYYPQVFLDDLFLLD